MKMLLKKLLQSACVIGFGWMIVTVSGCGSNSPALKAANGEVSTTESTSSPAMSLPTPTASPTPAKPVFPFSYPLTGLGSNEEVKERPIAVMVENSPAARPQTGLDQADIVYEIMAEGGITRFIALFQSESPSVIGPVRSIRPYFVEIADGMDAVIVHAGWSQAAMNILAGRKLNHLDQVYGDDAYYWRSKDRKMPHNLYTSVEKIKEGAVKKRFREEWNGPVLNFVNSDQAAVGEPAGKVTMNYLLGYQVSYQWDEKSAAYLRYMNGEAHLDKDSGKQLSAANVLIVESKHIVLDKEGREEIDVYGPGNGYILQQGKIRKVTWERKGGMIRAYIDGKEIGWLPGKTWIQIVKIGAKITYE